MRWLLSLLFVGFLGVARALSSSGNRLLVVLEDFSEKSLYSTFFSDLEGTYVRENTGNLLLWKLICPTLFLERGYSITIESPKNEKLSLFQHGDRAYDHLLILPPKSKGTY